MGSRSPVRVALRLRPTENISESFTVDAHSKTVSLRQATKDVTDGSTKMERLTFSADSVLFNASQETVFTEVGRPAADHVLDGFNGTVLCYGQTGAGKSFTMVGAGRDYAHRGLAPRAGARPRFCRCPREARRRLLGEG